MNPAPRAVAVPLSHVLKALCEGGDGESVTVGDIVHGFGSRAFGALLFIFAIPNVLPLPPGSSTVLGMPLLLLAPQVAIRVRRPWLPRFIDHRRIKAADLARMFGRIIPRLEAVERLSRPRWHRLFGPIGVRLIGVVCTLLALVLILPIPLGNLAPAIAIGALSLGLFQRDGVIVLVGYLMTAASIGLLALSAGATLGLVKLLTIFVL